MFIRETCAAISQLGNFECCLEEKHTTKTHDIFFARVSYTSRYCCLLCFPIDLRLFTAKSGTSDAMPCPTQSASGAVASSPRRRCPTLTALGPDPSLRGAPSIIQDVLTVGWLSDLVVYDEMTRKSEIL